MAARSTRRTFFALSALALLATLVAWALASPPEADPASAHPDSTDVAAPPPTVLPIPPTPDEDVPDTKLPLHLEATVVRENHTLSLATVEDTERRTNEVLREGDRFEAHPDAQIVRIERARVLIDHAGKREQLVITHLEPTELELRETSGAPVKPPEENGKQARVPAPVIERALGSRARPEGDVRPVFENGKMVGLRFDAIPAGGIYERIGLHSGDVVTNVNGIPLADPDATAMLLAQFASAAELDLSVARPDGSHEMLHLAPGGSNEAREPAGPGEAREPGDADEGDEEGE
jgi:type II secretion system protein C